MGDHQKYNCNATFVSRRDTLHKKLYEFCTLCDVKACMINFGPDNEIGTWPSDKEKVNAFIHDYKSAVAENLCKEKLLRKEKQKQSISGYYSSKNNSLLSYYEAEKTSLQLKVNETRMARFNKMSSAWSSNNNSNNHSSLPIESLRKSAATFESKLALLEEKLEMLLMSKTTTNSHQITATHTGKRKRVNNTTSSLQPPPPQQLQQHQPPQQLQQQEPPQQLQQQPPQIVPAIELGSNPMVLYSQTPMLTTQHNYNCNCNGAPAPVMVQWPHCTSNGTAGPPMPTFRPHEPIPIIWIWPPQQCEPHMQPHLIFNYYPPASAAAAPPPPQGPVDKPPNQS